MSEQTTHKIQIIFAPDKKRRDHKSKAIEMLTELNEKNALKETINAIIDPPKPDEPSESTNCHNVAIGLMHDLFIYPPGVDRSKKFSRRGWKILTGYTLKEDGSRWDHSWLECGHYAVDASGVCKFPDPKPGDLYIVVMDKWIYRKQLNITVEKERDDFAFYQWLKNRQKTH